MYYSIDLFNSIDYKIAKIFKDHTGLKHVLFTTFKGF